MEDAQLLDLEVPHGHHDRVGAGGAGATAVPLVAAAVLLVAAAMKLLDPRAIVTDGRLVYAAVIGVETVLGLWLLAGLWPQSARRAAIGLFTIFATVSLWYAISGRETCGCFGSISISPSIVLLLDVAIIAALVMHPPLPLGRSALNVRRTLATASACALVIVGVIGSSRSSTLDTAGQIVGDGSIIILEPDRWVGKPFPLISHIDTGERLRTGEWTAVLYRHDCGDCRRALPKYEQLAREGRRVMLIEIPPHPPASQDTVPRGSPLARGRLPAGREWFVQTPALVELRDGIVQGEPAKTALFRP